MPGPIVITAADPAPRAANWPVRPGGWDTHAHVFGPAARFPFAPDTPYTSPDQTVDDYLAMLDALGVTHGVLVQPSAYGTDNACLLAALEAQPGRLAGVVDLPVLSTPDATLAAMTRAGVCGLRVRPAAYDPGHLARVASRVRELGWHLDVLVDDTAGLLAIVPFLRTARVALMIEAMGNPRAGQPLEDAGFAALLGLLRDGVAHVKLSHAYHIDPGGVPYAATVPFARALVDAAPGRVVWGSDWPHPMREANVPNDGDLIDLLPAWAGSVPLAQAILCDNPARFYRTAATEEHRP